LPAFDVNGDSRVTITELIRAVGNALRRLVPPPRNPRMGAALHL
jgi:hypothetical protein